jgi:hypothetical protein
LSQVVHLLKLCPFFHYFVVSSLPHLQPQKCVICLSLAPTRCRPPSRKTLSPSPLPTLFPSLARAMVGGLPPRPGFLLRGLPVSVYNVFAEGNIAQQICGLCGSSAHSLRACPGSSFTDRVLAAQWHLRRWSALSAIELSAYANMSTTAYVRSREGFRPTLPFADIVAYARAAGSRSDPCPFRELPASGDQSRHEHFRVPLPRTLPAQSGSSTSEGLLPTPQLPQQQPHPEQPKQSPQQRMKPPPKAVSPQSADGVHANFPKSAPVVKPAPQAGPKPATVPCPIPKRAPKTKPHPKQVSQAASSAGPRVASCDSSMAYRRVPKKRGFSAAPKTAASSLPSTPTRGVLHPRDWPTPSPQQAKEPRPEALFQLSLRAKPRALALPCSLGSLPVPTVSPEEADARICAFAQESVANGTIAESQAASGISFLSTSTVAERLFLASSAAALRAYFTSQSGHRFSSGPSETAEAEPASQRVLMTPERYIQYSRTQRETFWKRATPAQAQEMWANLSARHRDEVQLLALRAGVTAAAFTLAEAGADSSHQNGAPAAGATSSSHTTAEVLPVNASPPPYESD